MSPQRIQLKRSKGWRMPPDTVKVDRSTIFGNPFKTDTREPAEAAALFREWLTSANWHKAAAEKYPPLIVTQLLARRQRILATLATLRGKHLACWCPLTVQSVDSCHASVLLELANKLPD
jgi:hypothetical protein